MLSLCKKSFVNFNKSKSLCEGGIWMDSQPEELFQRFGGEVAYGLVQNLMYPEHAHRGYEIICMLEGSAIIYTPERVMRVKPGQMVFISEHVIHGYLAQRDAKSLILVYVPRGNEAFVPLLSAKRHAILCLDEEQQPVIMKELRATLTRLPEEQKNFVSVTGYIHFLLSSMAQYADKQPPLPVQTPDSFGRALLAIGQSVSHLDEEENIARAAGLSKYYFSRMFCQRMGMSYSTYIALMRVDAARRMMTQTHLSIEEIVTRCGYASQRSFNRQFAAIVEKTPRQYRQESQNSKFFDYESPSIRKLLESRENWKVVSPQVPMTDRRCGAVF